MKFKYTAIKKTTFSLLCSLLLLINSGYATTSINIAPQFELLVNCGGGAVQTTTGLYEKDQFFTGDGKTFFDTNIKSKDLEDIYISERSTETFNGSFGYKIPVPNGTYTIYLHFAEIYWGATGGRAEGSGKRVFNTTIEDNLVLENFDIYKEVGAMTPLVKTFDVQVTDGELNMDFQGVIDQPKLSAFAVVSKNIALGKPLLKINSGGEKVTVSGTSFEADTYFEGKGKAFEKSAINTIASTDDDLLYKTERRTLRNNESFSYKIPVSQGTYQVRLHFAEIYWGATGGARAVGGERVFDVSIEGKKVIDDLDIYGEVGAMTALIKEFEANVSDGILDIDFTAEVDLPKLSALELFGDGSVINTKDDNCAWNNLANGPLEKLESQSAKVNGKLYTFSGFLDNLKITNATEIFDPKTNTWSKGAPIPVSVTHAGKAVVGQDIWIIAGFIGNHPGTATDKVQIYNTQKDTWTEGPSLPNPRGSGAAAYFNEKIHFFGGLLPDRRTDVGEHYVLDINNLSAGWKAAAPLPNPRNHLSAATVNGKIYAIGGQYGHDGGVDDQNFLDEYDPVTNEWTRKANLPSDRSHFEPGTIVHNDKIIIVGGRRGNFFYEDITEYNPASDQWNELCKLPAKLLAPNAEVFGNRLVIANGGKEGICCPLSTTQWIEVEPEQRTFNDLLISLEAENADLKGCETDQTHSGFSGSGFVDFIKTEDESIEWVIEDIPADGTYFIFFRYASQSENRPLQLVINDGVVADQLDFPATGAWNKWELTEVAAYLTKGRNSIQVVSNGLSGPNIDILIVSKVAERGRELSVVDNKTVTSDFLTSRAVHLKVVPNPVLSNLNFEFNLDKKQTFQVKIYSLNGKLYDSLQFSGTNGIYKDVIDTHVLPQGVYIFNVVSNQGTESKLFVKK
ncbi:malectin domain-containing carbohydrate-binding protein [Aquimarina sp. ERC-38]|uniref:malectin domain-containing carbohydrate-binding protein n=1 Tax=Aquimarina sp. ERC-38 TaxID=2949996 RepID=UPI0022484E62|nr:malectin domain-containing carbohydrate-binding protein [Aquimarina sp. ERC-38]UZO82526.1 malectin domain-containing carbohydrate-binding protein [Aquimarina sp. ERC-38]